MDRLPISLVVLTKNDQSSLKRCLSSAPWADDIIVLDSGSHDQTVPMARNFGARVFTEHFRGERNQKQRAVELAKHNWVLLLSSKEALSKELSREIEDFAKSNDINKFDGFSVPRLTYLQGRWIWRSGLYPKRDVRLFHRSRCRWAKDDNVGTVSASLVKEFKSNLLYWPQVSFSETIKNLNNESTLRAKTRYGLGDRSSRFKMIFKPVSRFISHYIFKRGFLDGYQGLLISFEQMLKELFYYSKLREFEFEALPLQDPLRGLKPSYRPIESKTFDNIQANFTPATKPSSQSSELTH